jgi:dTDP-4-dehydrorhamnose reductase
MKIFITGGSGLLGRNLIKFLTEKGHEIIAPDSKTVDIRNLDALSDSIKKAMPDLVIHCAAVSKFADAEKRPIDTIDINIIGTCNVVKCCMDLDVRLIFISSSHVFDGKDGLYKKTDKVNPQTKYAMSKVAGEMTTQIHKNSLIIRTEFCEETFPFPTAYIDKYSSKEYIDVVTPMISEKCLSQEVGITHVGGPRRSFYDFGKIRNPDVLPGTVKDIIEKSSVPILIDTSLEYD